MSPQSKGRFRAAYLLIALNLVCLVATGLVLYKYLQLRDALAESSARDYQGCLRGNELRHVGRVAMHDLGHPGLELLPAIAKQPCRLLYPDGYRPTVPSP